MPNKRNIRIGPLTRLAVAAVAALLLPAAAIAATVTSTGTGNWYDGGTWDAGVPGPLDDVVIDVGDTVTITGTTAIAINSLEVDGTLTHADNSTTEEHKVVLVITNNCTVAGGGRIDVTALGYGKNQGPGKPVGGTYQGGSHGGRGGVISGQDPENAGPVYGSYIAPTNLGSGGNPAESWAGGGGAVSLTVGGTTTVDGSINADGQVGSGGHSGGAGGSVFITTANFGGSGTVSANGGFGSVHTGGGGGGRIAVALTSGSSFGSVTLTAYGGPTGRSRYAGAGTVYTKTPSQTYGTLTIDNNGFDLIDSNPGGPTLCSGTRIPPGDTWQVDSLELVNGGNLWVTTNTTLNVDGTDFNDSTTNGYLLLDSYGTLAGPTSLTISNFTFMPLAGSIFSIVNLAIDPSAQVTHIENPSSEDWTLEIDIAGNLTIPAGVNINLDGLGYGYRRGPGRPTANYNFGHGGSYGGRGGKTLSYIQDSGPTYGSITGPVNIGSGGGWNGSGGINDGGGAIKLTVGGTTALDGDLSANGLGISGSAQGGGSGGSVWLTTSNLTGNGTITADGGPGSSAGAGGGGGRISVVLTGSDSFGSVTMQAYGGSGPGAQDAGAAGTIYKQTQSQGAGMGDLLIDNNGQDSRRNTEISSNVTDTVVGSVTFLDGADFGVRTDQTFTVQGGIWSNGNEFVADPGSVVSFTTTNTVRIYGGQTFAGLAITSGGKRVEFEDGKTNGVTETLTITGDSGDLLLLRSVTDGQQTYFDVDSAVNPSLEYLDVKDNNADLGRAMRALNSSNSLNNSNWVFAVASETNVWIGTTNSDWGAGANWIRGGPPIAADDVTIISNGVFDPLLPSAQTLNRLEVYAGATLGLNGFDLTVNDTAAIAGSILATGAETIDFNDDATVSGALIFAGTENVFFAGDVDFTGAAVTEATSHAFIDGGTAQTVTSGGQSFYRLTVTNDSALVTFIDSAQATYYRSESANVTYSNDFTTTEFRVYSEGGAVTQTFNSGSTYAIVDLLLNGTLGNTQHLESTSSSDWFLNVSRMAYVRYVNAGHSDASGGIEIIAFNSTDSGNNVNWSFGGPFAVWTANTDSDFHTADNWDPSGVPDATTRIMVDNVTTLTVGSPATVQYALIGGDNATHMEVNSSFTVVSNVDVGINATLEINDDPGMTVSNDMYVAPGATLIHEANTTTEANTMILTVEGDLTIASGGSIDVTGLGYDKREGPGQPAPNYLYGHGGSYGGRGGYTASYPGGDSGPTYGSIRGPTNIGSGGGWYNVNPGINDGGGAMMVTVGGTTTLNGELSADGLGYLGSISTALGGGSGGSVWLTTSGLAGNGTITADGGIGSPAGGGGGGGRISVVLTGSDSFGSVEMQAFGGSGPGVLDGGAAGTIYKQTQAQGDGAGTVIVDNNGEASGRSTYAPPQTLAVTDELTATTIIITNAGSEVTLSTNIWVGDILVYTNANLVVGSYTMYVDSVEHHLDNRSKSGAGQTNHVDFYNQIVWIGPLPGTFILIR